MIEVAGLRHCFGRREVLRDLTFSLEKGGFAFLTGPSGAVYFAAQLGGQRRSAHTGSPEHGRRRDEFATGFDSTTIDFGHAQPGPDLDTQVAQINHSTHRQRIGERAKDAGSALDQNDLGLGGVYVAKVACQHIA